MKAIALILLASFLSSLLVIESSSSSSTTVEEDESNGLGEWKMLTKHNFSSQIRLHPHILLFVTVPWSGECRSLMRQVAHVLSGMREDFGSLKLMYMYHHEEKILAEAIGATEEISVLFYHHFEHYRYRGQLRAKNILLSVRPYLLVAPEQIPITSLNTQEELELFLESTDKALLLLEFCGWTPKLVASKKNGTTSLDLQGDISMMGNVKSDGLARIGEKEDQKEEESGKLKCAVENRYGGIPWLGDFSSVNHSASQDTSFEDVEVVKSNLGSTCTINDYQQFKPSFSRFMSLAKEFFLPVERHRFAHVSNISLLSSLGVEHTDSWSIMLYFHGCPSCSVIINEGEDLKRLLRMDNPIVAELESSGRDVNPTIPASKPSVVLFLDRMSESSETRKNSKEAFDSFRQLALHYQGSDQCGRKSNDQHERSSQVSQDHMRKRNLKPRLSSSAQKIKLNDKMSIMIMNEEKSSLLENIASDVQGRPLHEILTYLLQQKGEVKFSSVAKQVGFQLLSDDFDIKLAETLPSEATEAKVEREQAESVKTMEDLVSTIIDVDKDTAPGQTNGPQPSDKLFPQDDNLKPTYSDANVHLSVNPVRLSDHGVDVSENVGMKEDNTSQVDNSGGGQQFKHFNGSFFFCDGNHRFLRALTGEAQIPTMVIIDPIANQHYVMAEQEINYHTMENFLNKFLSRSLVPYQLSKSAYENHKKATHPPFVNLDFHEANAIPRITANSFAEHVLGFNHSASDESTNAWEEDVVVLFSNAWCGFSQRMELVVREVFRAMKGYMDMLKIGFRDGEKLSSTDNMNQAVQKLPKIFLMDCSLTDCSLILKSLGQREVYPTLLLFPAENKTALYYGGNMAVADVIKFVAEHGSNSYHLISQTGILWTVGNEENNQNFFQNTVPTTIHVDTAKEKSQEILLKDQMQKREKTYSQLKSYSPKSFQEQVPHVVVGSILFATEKISTQPFLKSGVLIVKADQSSGFQGLIINKPISWDSLNENVEGLESLKEAPLYFGGPLIKQGLLFAALTRREVHGKYTEVAPGIYFVDHEATTHEIEEVKSGNQHLNDYWFFLGFGSWGYDQLFDEIAEGAWILGEYTGHLNWPES